MKLELLIINSPQGYDIRISNKSNKSRGLSAWKQSIDGLKDIQRQLISIANEIEKTLEE
jgi:hypothetical protein